jgi:hypothetical protein
MTAPQTGDNVHPRAEIQKVESGTVLKMTPHIADNNDITLQMAVEVSDSIPKARGSDLPLVTRRTAKNSVTVKDGGTGAVGGLTENRTPPKDRSSREVVVFVTAHLVADKAEAHPEAPPAAAAVHVPPPTRESSRWREGSGPSESWAPAENREPAKPTVQVHARFVAADERLLRDLRGRGAIRGVASPQETETLHEIGRMLSEGKSLVLADDQAELLMKAVARYRDSRMLAAPKVTAPENEQTSFWIGSKIPYTAGYEEPNEPAGTPRPRQATLDSGLKFETLAHLVGQGGVRLDSMLRVTTLLGFDEKKYKRRYPYQVPKTEDVVFSLDNPVVPSGETTLTLGPKARLLKASGRPQTILILVRPSIVEGKIGPEAADATARPPDSRARYVMRQPNCPPLLLGLTQQLLKVLQPARQNDAMWREVKDGGTLRLKLEIEADQPGEVTVGLFKDARWSAPPVAVRRLSAGTHVLTGLPTGRYQIGAMLGNAPFPAALGVHRTWPEPVEIQAGATAAADVLVSEAFEEHASGWYNEEVAKDYIGDWGNLNESNLLQGQLTGPDSKPIPFGEIMIREHRTDNRGFAAPNQGTNEQGLYKFDKMAWPYRVTARWRELLPSSFGCRYQTMSLNRVLEGSQRISFRFDPFLQGTAKLTGRVLDQNGRPVEGFFLRVLGLSSDKLRQGWEELDGKTHTYTGYDVPFFSKDGSFELSGLPEGAATAQVIPFEGRRYEHGNLKDVSLTAGQATSLDFQLTGKDILYGRVLFEDGTAAVVRPAPWRGAATRIVLARSGTYRGPGVSEVDAQGYFAVYLGQGERQELASGPVRLSITLPAAQEHRFNTVGEFPFDELSQDKSQAGVLRIKRPESMAPAPTEKPGAREIPAATGVLEKARRAWMAAPPAPEPPIRTPEKDMVIFELKERIAEVERGIDFLQQTLGPTHPAIARKQALLATLREELEKKPTRFESAFWDSVRPRQIAFEGSLASIHADATLDADTAMQAFALVAQADEATRASLPLEELRAATIQQILQRLGPHMPAEPFQALLRLLESKGLVHLIAGIGVCIPEDRLWTTPGPVLAEPPSRPLALHVFGEIVEPEHMVLLDMEATVKLTEPGRSPAGPTSDQPNVPESTRVVEWTGSPVIPSGGHAVLLLDSVKPAAEHPREVPCLIVHPTIVEPQPPAAAPAGSAA